jgi:hypothetical protein
MDARTVERGVTVAISMLVRTDTRGQAWTTKHVLPILEKLMRSALARIPHLVGTSFRTFGPITRRSQVQILPPLLQRPGNGAFVFFGAEIGGRNLAQTFARMWIWLGPRGVVSVCPLMLRVGWSGSTGAKQQAWAR